MCLCCKAKKFQFFSTLTLLEVGDVLGGEGDADAVHLLDLALSLGSGSLVSTSRHLFGFGGKDTQEEGVKVSDRKGEREREAKTKRAL